MLFVDCVTSHSVVLEAIGLSSRDVDLFMSFGDEGDVDELTGNE